MFVAIIQFSSVHVWITWTSSLHQQVDGSTGCVNKLLAKASRWRQNVYQQTGGRILYTASADAKPKVVLRVPASFTMALTAKMRMILLQWIYLSGMAATDPLARSHHAMENRRCVLLATHAILPCLSSFRLLTRHFALRTPENGTRESHAHLHLDDNFSFEIPLPLTSALAYAEILGHAFHSAWQRGILCSRRTCRYKPLIVFPGLATSYWCE